MRFLTKKLNHLLNIDILNFLKYFANRIVKK